MIKALAHYEITSQIGKGGMGEVFRAKDQKLGREVAIKVLPEEFAQDTDRVARFQREAKLLASLNHPNIAAIYGLEEFAGTNFLVLELVEGETLADRIKAGPIPVEESLKLALQIAEALEAAHEKGVIHRDLKPANIKVTPEGKAKVLDFGLAKAYAGDGQEVNLSNSPTLSDVATQQGMILGTAAYMSPEQARGRTVDKRADIWAFGCVLFEMLSGRAAFSGRDVTDILAAVIRSEPDWSMLPANLHGRLREVLERCVKKEVRDRYHDISDVRVDLQKVLTDPSGVLVQPLEITETRIRWRTTLGIAAAIAITAILVGLVVWNSRAPEPRQVIRFDYELPDGQQLTNLPLAVSPDGKQFVYSTSKGLFLRSVNELTAKLIAGSEGDTRQPFFSPDGRWIGYFSIADRQLKKISINGGAPVSLCDVGGVGMAGASWGTDDMMVLSAIPHGIMRIPASGGTPESLIKTESYFFESPQILQNGKSLLYTAYNSGFQQPRIMVRQLKSGESKELLPGTVVRYLPNGYLIYQPPDITTVYAIPVNPDTLAVAGEPVPLLEDVGFADISDSGTLVYIPSPPRAKARRASGRTLVWVDREGKEEPLGTPPNFYAYPKISPDGKRVAVSVGETPNEDIWIWDTVRKNLTKLTFEKTRDMLPIWSPDGKRIAYWADTAGASPNGVFLKPADGTGEAEKLISAPNGQLHPFSWSNDGKTLLMQEVVTWTNLDISVLSMEKEHTKKPLLQSERAETQPKISPDGQWMAYTSNDSGRDEIYVRPFPDVTGGKWQVSTQGGTSPLWSPHGRELFYLSEDNQVMAVAVETEPTLGFQTPKVLFKNENLGFGAYTGTPWDIHPDGKRFLMIKQPGVAPSAEEVVRPRITIVLNWFEELKQRVPVK
jgi:Tol biopolymer transport system component